MNQFQELSVLCARSPAHRSSTQPFSTSIKAAGEEADQQLIGAGLDLASGLLRCPGCTLCMNSTRIREGNLICKNREN